MSWPLGSVCGLTATNFITLAPEFKLLLLLLLLLLPGVSIKFT